MSSSDKEKNNEHVIDILFQLGANYLEKGEYDNAIEKFKNLIDLGAADAKMYLNLSKAYILKEQFDEEAQKIFEKSLQFEPGNPVLNVILSQVYLDAGREDEQALNVYRKALKHNPQNADDISGMLIKASFQQGNIDIARELIQQFIHTPEKLINFLPLYIVNEWKHQGFDRVTQYLKSAIKVQENLFYYRWLVVNFLQAEKQSFQPIELSVEDLNLCNYYLKNIDSFNQLLDIYLYPAIERLLKKNIKKFEKPNSKEIEEYEIFLAENALSNIWEKGLIKEDVAQNILNLKEGSIWKKLKPWQFRESIDDGEVESESEETDRIGAIQNQAKTLMVLQLEKTTSDDINKTFQKSISTISKAKQAFVGGFKLSDGFLLFWKDVNYPLRIARSFIQDYPGQNLVNSNDESRIQFVIHKLSRKGKDGKRDIANDLQTTLSIFQLEREMFFQDNHSDQLKSIPKCQLLVTSALKDNFDGDGQFSLEPLELSAQHPTAEKDLQIYRLTWDDSLAKIRRGEIQDIGQFKLLKELHHNQIFSSFKAIDSFLDRLVVVKILNPDFKRDVSQDSIARLFLKEAKFLGQLSHPNIAMVYDIGAERDFCFLAREFVEGVPLTVQKSINKKINVRRTLEICLNIVRSLNYLHDQNIFHGRLQPNDIFVLNNNEIKLTDLQIAAFTIPLMHLQGASLKYLSYFAPEQIDNKQADNLTDMFSFGTIMYEMLTDSNPFYNEDRDVLADNILNKTPEPPSFYNSDLPIELDQIILKIMDKIPAKRFKNMRELEKELVKVIGILG